MTDEEEKALIEAKLAVLKAIKHCAEHKQHGELAPIAEWTERLAHAYALLNETKTGPVSAY